MGNLTSYSDKLRDPRWQKKRIQVLQRDSFTCHCCTDQKTELQVHHFKYTGNPWDAHADDLTTLCKHCHLLVEYYKKVNNHAGFRVLKLETLSGQPYVRLIAFHGNTIGVFIYCEEDSQKPLSLVVVFHRGEIAGIDVENAAPFFDLRKQGTSNGKTN